MKPRNFFLVVLAFLIALIGIGFWWFTQRKTVTPEKMAAAHVPAKIEVPQPLSPPQVAQPLITPEVINPSTTLADVPPASNDPQADLETAIPDIVSFLRSGDIVGFNENYFPPGTVDPKAMEQVRMTQERVATLVTQNPRVYQQIKNQHDAVARTYEALESQTPIYNEAGDEATYQYEASGLSRPMTFIKINGEWYIKPPDVKGNSMIAH